MAYVTTNQPYKIAGGFGAGKTLWVYSSADDDSTVIAATYITDSLALGMKVGDAVLIWDTATPKGSLAFVTVSSAAGSTMTFAAVA
jgi:hypothetical protein